MGSIYSEYYLAMICINLESFLYSLFVVKATNNLMIERLEVKFIYNKFSPHQKKKKTLKLFGFWIWSNYFLEELRMLIIFH